MRVWHDAPLNFRSTAAASPSTDKRPCCFRSTPPKPRHTPTPLHAQLYDAMVLREGCGGDVPAEKAEAACWARLVTVLPFSVDVLKRHVNVRAATGRCAYAAAAEH